MIDGLDRWQGAALAFARCSSVYMFSLMVFVSHNLAIFVSAAFLTELALELTTFSRSRCLIVVNSYRALIHSGAGRDHDVRAGKVHIGTGWRLTWLPLPSCQGWP